MKPMHHYKFGGPLNGLQKTWQVRAWCGRNILNTRATSIMAKVTCKQCVAAKHRFMRNLNRRLTKGWTNE